ncbi:hypothetical protein DI273_03845 [Streptomyces violascens]|nr:hypothetical protein DI273_03845 [Streptomyces violascens]
MHQPPPPRRRRAAWAAAAFTATALLTAPHPASAAEPAPAPAAKVDSALSAAVAGGGDASFFVILKDQAKLADARGRRSHAAKAESAFKELRAKADDTQGPLRAFLDRKKVGHQDFWGAPFGVSV